MPEGHLSYLSGITKIERDKMKKVKIKDLEKGDIVVSNLGAFYYEFDSYEPIKNQETVRVNRVGSNCAYYVSKDDTVYVAECLSDLRRSS